MVWPHCGWVDWNPRPFWVGKGVDEEDANVTHTMHRVLACPKKLHGGAFTLVSLHEHFPFIYSSTHQLSTIQEDTRSQQSLCFLGLHYVLKQYVDGKREVTWQRRRVIALVQSINCWYLDKWIILKERKGVITPFNPSHSPIDLGHVYSQTNGLLIRAGFFFLPSKVLFFISNNIRSCYTIYCSSWVHIPWSYIFVFICIP